MYVQKCNFAERGIPTGVSRTNIMHHRRLSPFLTLVIVLLASVCFISCSQLAPRIDKNDGYHSSDNEYDLFYELENGPVIEQKIVLTFDHRHSHQTFRVSRSVDEELKRISASIAAKETDDPTDVHTNKVRGRKNSLDGSSKSPRTVLEFPLLKEEKGETEQLTHLGYCCRAHCSLLVWFLSCLLSILCKTAVKDSSPRNQQFHV